MKREDIHKSQKGWRQGLLEQKIIKSINPILMGGMRGIKRDEPEYL